MKNIFSLLLMIAMVAGLRTAFLSPTGSNDFRLYGGPRPNTKIVANVPALGSYVELPRFPLDVIVYSPLKFVSFMDINVIDREETPKEHKLFLKNPLDAGYSLAYCYLRMLYEYRVGLPVEYSSKDIKYNAKELVFRKGDSLELDNINLDRLSEKAKRDLLSAITIQAQRDTAKMGEASENCIVELTGGSRPRYVWGYQVIGKYLYVVDPCAPQLLYARIDLETGKYYVGTHVYQVRSFMRKLKIPVVKMEEEAG